MEPTSTRDTNVYLRLWPLVLAEGTFCANILLGVASNGDPAWNWVALLLQVMLNLSLAHWMVLDLRSASRRVPRSSQAWLFVFAPIVVPIYVIWSRGFVGLAVIVMHIVVAVMLAVGASAYLHMATFQ